MNAPPEPPDLEGRAVPTAPVDVLGGAGGADSFGGAVRVFGWSQKARRIIVGCGVFLAVGMTALFLWTVPLRTSLSCAQASHQCEVVRLYVSGPQSERFDFAEVEQVTSHIEIQNTGKGARRERVATGRATIAAHLNDGRRVNVTEAIEGYNAVAEALRAQIGGAGAPTVEHTTTIAVRDVVFVVVFLVVGLLLIAWSRHETRLMNSAGFISVEQRRFPLLPKQVLHCRSDAVESIDVQGGDFIHTVTVLTNDGERHVVARFFNRFRASELRGAIDRAAGFGVRKSLGGTG